MTKWRRRSLHRTPFRPPRPSIASSPKARRSTGRAARLTCRSNRKSIRVPVPLQISGRQRRRLRRLGAAHHLRHGGIFVHRRGEAPADIAGRDRETLLRPGDSVRPRTHRADGHHARWRDPEGPGRGAECRRGAISRPAKPKILGLFGSGWQASAHLEFLCSEWQFERVKVFSPNQEHCREFCAKMIGAARSRNRTLSHAPGKAVEGSDFVQAATAAWDAVFDGHLVEKGMYVASIGGSDASNKRREIDDETIRRADLYVVHSKEVARLDQSPDVWEAAQKGIKPWESIQRSPGSGCGQASRAHQRRSDHSFQ